MNKMDMDVVVKNLISEFAEDKLREGYKYLGYHQYHDASGDVLYFKIRLKHEDGRKWIRPFHFDLDKQVYVLREPKFDHGKPLYRLPEIKKYTEEVWINEGEACVEAMEKYGILATTSGSSTSANQTDFTPLQGRSIIIWPDNNKAGLAYANEVTKKLFSLNAKVMWVDINQLNLPEGGDFVDWLESKFSLSKSDIKEEIYSLPLISPSLHNSDENNFGKSNSNKHGYISHREASEIEIKPVSWLWPDRFARGKVSMLSGHPGLGKSQVCTIMAGTITRGGKWPDGTDCVKGRVIFLNAEDDAADTIVPRLIAADADLTQVNFIDAVIEIDQNGNESMGQFNMVTDVDALEKLLISLKDVAAIFIDPVSAYLGNTDDHKNSRVRSVLSPLAKLAEKYNVAIICVSHHNKSEKQEALMRVIGSIGFVAASRAAFAVIKDKEDKTKRYFLPLKNNIGNDSSGLAFKIESYIIDDGIKTSRVAWSDECVTITADEAMSCMQGDSSSALEDAEEFLKDILKDGLKYTKDILEAAEAEGISEKTLRRAKQKQGVKVGRNGFGNGGRSYWYL